MNASFEQESRCYILKEKATDMFAQKSGYIVAQNFRVSVIQC